MIAHGSASMTACSPQTAATGSGCGSAATGAHSSRAVRPPSEQGNERSAALRAATTLRTRPTARDANDPPGRGPGDRRLEERERQWTTAILIIGRLGAHLEH